MSEAKLKTVAPVLCVGAIQPMVDYFTDRLGFQLQGSVGDPLSWASLQRDHVEVMLVCGPSFPAPAQDWAAYIYLDRLVIDQLHDELLARGADILGGPVDKPYGCREFEVRLPDGRLLAFGG